MGLTNVTCAEIRKYLPGTILGLGYPDNIDHVDLKGSSLTCVDIIAHHGFEKVRDLSVPGVLQDLGQFDLVIDSGTTEHCANICNAYINAASAVKVGGHIIHEVPINMPNHGYWNISPIWFFDFYEANKFVVERCDRTLSAPFDVSKVLPWPGGSATQQLNNVPEVCCTLCVARRTTAAPITIPKCQDVWIK